MAATDMEVGESFTMDSSFDLSDVHATDDIKEIAYANEHSFEEVDVRNVIKLDIDIKNFMVIPANSSVGEMIVNGYKVVTVVPEN